jgi:hypothetical protein
MRKTDIVSSRLIGCQVLLTTPWVWAISCGDTLGPGGTFTLEADLVCPEPTEALALTLIDGATLDLHGFSLRLYNAVALLGSGTTIRNGTIANCNGATITACGVGAGGSGGHLMERLSITSGNQAIGLGSDGNVVQDCRLAADQGVIIAGNHNLIQRVEARGAFPAFLVSGDHNVLTRNVSSGGQHGYSVAGNSNALLGNTANGDGLAGISVDGDNNLILENMWRPSVLASPFKMELSIIG